MRDMVTAMAQLRESSGIISKIIKTIDDLAFQTNLLAINATIEAARAGGDAGRSFSVVAEEVRNLASKSATAAADTAAIIDKNITLANSGNQISCDVSESLESIADQFSNLERLISEINAASEEQNVGVRQINEAVSQIEKSTQSNAATSEESAASAAMLRELINDLEGVYHDIHAVVNGAASSR
jgi:methyl-accepting chemotaxis protein